MLSVKEIDDVMKKHKKELYGRYRVKEIGIFGSVVRGELKRKSDIDILVEFDEVPDLLKFIELERYLSRLLKKKVDLVEKTALRPRLKEVILSEVIYL